MTSVQNPAALPETARLRSGTAAPAQHDRGRTQPNGLDFHCSPRCVGCALEAHAKNITLTSEAVNVHYNVSEDISSYTAGTCKLKCNRQGGLCYAKNILDRVPVGVQHTQRLADLDQNRFAPRRVDPNTSTSI